jgi:hypothetical protein
MSPDTCGRRDGRKTTGGHSPGTGESRRWCRRPGRVPARRHRGAPACGLLLRMPVIRLTTTYACKDYALAFSRRAAAWSAVSARLGRPSRPLGGCDLFR